MKRPELMNLIPRRAACVPPPGAPHGAGWRARPGWGRVGAGRLSDQRPVIGDEVMYSIGGGSAVSMGRAAGMRSIGVGVGWNSNLICGDMSIQTTLRNQLNGSQRVQQIMSNVIQSATSAVASLPALIIQRADPGLYNLLTNGVLQARLDFDRSKLTCRADGREDGRDGGRPARMEPDGGRHGAARCGVEHGCRIGDRGETRRQRRRALGGWQQCRRRGPVGHPGGR